jgi:hypothetical protein
LSGSQLRARQVPKRIRGEVTMGDLKVGVRAAQPLDHRT